MVGWGRWGASKGNWQRVVGGGGKGGGVVFGGVPRILRSVNVNYRFSEGVETVD